MIESNQNTEVLKKINIGNWESDLRIIDEITIVVPLRLLLVCNHIASNVDENEFSIVTDIKEKTLERIILSEEYYIPRQIVSPGSIDYLPDDYSHNVVIHRHPDGLNSFSSTDHGYINQNFELSLLYTKKDSFVNGVYNLKVEDAIIPLPVRVIIECGIDEIDLDNIEYKKYIPELIEKRTLKDETVYYPEEIIGEISDLRNRMELIEGYFLR